VPPFVRSQKIFDDILATPTVKALAPGTRLPSVIVPDFLADNAYDEAVKGIQYILHVASPAVKGDGFSPDQYETYLIGPAMKGTVGMLEFAYKTQGIKRVVITSSEVAIIPWKELIMEEVDTVFTEKYEDPFLAGLIHRSLKSMRLAKCVLC